jgi:Ca-activated chloride channel family protein
LKSKSINNLKISSIKGFKSSESFAWLKPYLSVLRLVALSSLIVAIARPTVDISNKTKLQRNRYRYGSRCVSGGFMPKI